MKQWYTSTMHERASTSYEMAVRDFQRARRAAVLRQTLARLRGQSNELLDYDTVRQQFKSSDSMIEHGLEEIPLHKIVGSVGRYQDFTREFLPKQQSDESRWANVKAAVTDMAGLPPIDLYQIGDAYFVLDGNHRVSVARMLGNKTISAHVTEIPTRVALAADDAPDEVICKARYAGFLAQTNLDQQYPDVDLLMTVPGHYRTLTRQIRVQHQLLLEQVDVDDEAHLWDSAAMVWYESVYLPVINIVRELGVMRRFPRRTETDIYVLLSERSEELEQALGWHLDIEETVPLLVEEESKVQTDSMPVSTINRMVESIIPVFFAEAPIGRWRTQQLAMHREGRLFADLLILFEGIDEDWALLEGALHFASSDHDRLLALRIVDHPDQCDSPAIREMASRFQRQCQAAGIVGEFAVEGGDAVSTLLKRAAWSDLLFINLTCPPGSTILNRLQSFWGPVITRSPRPLLVVPHANYRGLNRMLLAYDGSPKADEALFVATYNAARWGHSLTVVGVETVNTRPDVLANAKAYLERHGVDNAKYILRQGNIGEGIMTVAEALDCNAIIMGGFGARPVMRLLRGSAVEYVLQHAKEQAVMICQ